MIRGRLPERGVAVCLQLLFTLMDWSSPLLPRWPTSQLRLSASKWWSKEEVPVLSFRTYTLDTQLSYFPGLTWRSPKTRGEGVAEAYWKSQVVFQKEASQPPELRIANGVKSASKARSGGSDRVLGGSQWWFRFWRGWQVWDCLCSVWEKFTFIPRPSCSFST